MLPDDSGDEEDLPVAWEQQGPEEGLDLHIHPQNRPKKEQQAAAECRQLWMTNRNWGFAPTFNKSLQ